MDWIQTSTVKEIEERGRIVIRNGVKQIALMKVNGHIFAIDNRCPHEGYPLSEGTVNPQNCILTCNWHNWKFHLPSGENISGDDNAGTYPTKIENGRIWVGIPEIPVQAIKEQSLKQLQKAFRDQTYDRIARELARMHFHKIDPLLAIKHAIQWSYDKLEYGMDHAYAVTADWVTLYSELTDIEDRLICLTEAIDHMAENSLRQPSFPYSDRVIPFSHNQFLDAVEREEEDEAVAMINGALAEGKHFRDVEHALSEAALQHYNDFGHSLIYITKVEILLRLLGEEMEKYLLPSLVRSILVATREDLLPEFRKLPGYIEKWKTPAPTTHPMSDDLFGKSLDYCLQWTVEQTQHVSLSRIYQTLLQTAARNLLHYDMAYQFSTHNLVSQNIGWLDFTHGITFASAVRRQCTKFPDLWKYGLLQMACFAGRNRAYIDSDLDESAWITSENFFEQSIREVLDHGKSAPIFSAHYVKTLLAARIEAAEANETCRDYVLAAVNRFLHSPLKEKHVRRTVYQALELVGRDFETVD